MVAWHLPTRSAISPGFAPFAYISSIIRRSSSFKHSYFIASPPFLRKKISASELISSFALNDKRHRLFETLNNLTLRESRRFYHTEVSIEDIAESYELTELPMACHIPMGLSGSEQEIILLRIDKGYSFLELAEHFGISEMACRQRLSRALHKCRTLLEEPLGSTPK